MDLEQARKLQATLVRNYDPPTRSRVKCRAFSVAKNYSGTKRDIYILPNLFNRLEICTKLVLSGNKAWDSIWTGYVFQVNRISQGMSVQGKSDIQSIKIVGLDGDVPSKIHRQTFYKFQRYPFHQIRQKLKLWAHQENYYFLHMSYWGKSWFFILTKIMIFHIK